MPNYLHGFGPKIDGWKTTSLDFKPTSDSCGALTSNCRSLGLGVPSKPQISTLAHLASITQHTMLNEPCNRGSTFASSHLNLKIPNLHWTAPSEAKLPPSLHDLQLLSLASTYPLGSNTTRANRSCCHLDCIGTTTILRLGIVTLIPDLFVLVVSQKRTMGGSPYGNEMKENKLGTNLPRRQLSGLTTW